MPLPPPRDIVRMRHMLEAASKVVAYTDGYERLVLDTDESWHSPGVPSDSFEAAVRVVASVGTRHIKDGFAVTLHGKVSSPQEKSKAEAEVKKIDGVSSRI